MLSFIVTLWCEEDKYTFFLSFFDLVRKLSQQKRLPASVSRGVGITDEFFAVLTTFWRISAKIYELLASILCIPADVSIAVG